MGTGSRPPALVCGVRRLRESSARVDVVSRLRTGKWARIPMPGRGLPQHCVSQPAIEMSDDFPKNHGHLQPYCVSHRLPAKSRPLGLGPLATLQVNNPPSHSFLAKVRPLADSPVPAAPAVTFSLARGTAANTLAVTRSGVGAEPVSTDATRALLDHPLASSKTTVAKRPRTWKPRGSVGGSGPGVSSG